MKKKKSESQQKVDIRHKSSKKKRVPRKAQGQGDLKNLEDVFTQEDVPIDG